MADTHVVHWLKADLDRLSLKRLQRVCECAAIPPRSLIGIGGEGGIRTHGTVTRTTVFEFYDSHDGPCRAVAKRVLWFVNFDHAILACNARCYPVPCGWFAIWFAKSLSGYRAEANARVRALWAGLCPHSVPRRGARKAPVIAPSGQLTYRH